MRRTVLVLVLLVFSAASRANASLILYDNTTTDTFDTVLFSIGPYSGLGDQIQLTAAGTATSALLQMYNAGAAGTFDALLEFYQVGAPVGAAIGGTFTVAGVASTGSDVIDLTFSLGSLGLPQNVVFVVRIDNVTGGMDLGVNMFEPPTVGSSDNTFMIVDDGGFIQVATADENVYLRLMSDEVVVPEPSTLGLMLVGLASVVLQRYRPRRLR